MSQIPVEVQTLPLTVTPASLEAFAGGNPVLPPVWEPFTQADFLQLVKSILPYSYWQPMFATGKGWEIFEMFGTTFERVAQAIAETWNGLYILTAGGGARASVVVAFSRPTAQLGPFVQKAGTVVATARGLKYVTTADIAFGPSDVGPINVSALATYPSAQFNVIGPYSTAAGELVPGPIDRILLPFQDPPFSDPTVTVAQVTPATGGVSANLDALALDQGKPRVGGESDDAARTQLRTFADQVSPVGLQTAVSRYLGQWKASASYEEPWQTNLFPHLNAPLDAIPGSSFDPSLAFLNAPPSLPGAPVRARGIMGWAQADYFLFVVPNLPAIEDFAGYLNDPSVSLSERRTPLGMRGTCFLNCPLPSSPPQTDGSLPYPVSVLSGADYRKNTVYSGLFALLSRIKAAGISYNVWLEGQ